MHVCMYACVHVCMYACVHVCMYACMHVCMCACVHVCMYACVHACVCACVRWFVSWAAVVLLCTCVCNYTHTKYTVARENACYSSCALGVKKHACAFKHSYDLRVTCTTNITHTYIRKRLCLRPTYLIFPLLKWSVCITHVCFQPIRSGMRMFNGRCVTNRCPPCFQDIHLYVGTNPFITLDYIFPYDLYIQVPARTFESICPYIRVNQSIRSRARLHKHMHPYALDHMHPYVSIYA